MKLAHLVQLTENASAQVMPSTQEANSDLLDELGVAGYTENPDDILVTVDLGTKYVSIVRDHVEGGYLVSTWFKANDGKSGDYGFKPVEGTLYDCVNEINKQCGTQFQIKH